MDVMLGFLAGYIFATKFGNLNPQEINEAWGNIRKSKEIRAAMGASMHIARYLLQQAVSKR